MIKSIIFFSIFLVTWAAEPVPTQTKRFCMKQFDSNIKCMLELVGSDHTKYIENKTMDIFHRICAPDYPPDCFAEFTTARDCYVATKSRLDAEGHLKKQKDEANIMSVNCLEKKGPPNFLADLQDIFLPSPLKLLSAGLGRALWGHEEKKAIRPPPGLTALFGGAPTPKPKGPGSKENSEETPTMFGRPECRVTRKHFVCTFEELVKASRTDDAFKNATSSLKAGAQDCKKVLQQNCTANTSEENKCVAEARLPLVLAFVDEIKSCMEAKGYTLPSLPFTLPPAHGKKP